VVTGNRAKIEIRVTQAILPAMFRSADRIVCITPKRGTYLVRISFTPAMSRTVATQSEINDKR
jgi:hypothetical protein